MFSELKLELWKSSTSFFTTDLALNILQKVQGVVLGIVVRAEDPNRLKLILLLSVLGVTKAVIVVYNPNICGGTDT